MPKLLPRNRSARIIVILVAITVVLVGGLALAWKVGRPAFKNFRERRANAVAREALQRGDYTTALLAVRKTLSYNQMNVDAWRLGVEITEKQNSSDIVLYQQRLANAQPTFENRLKFVQLALKYHAYNEADAMIKKVGVEGSKSAEFLEGAALISRHLGNGPKAKYYLMSLIALQPNNSKARLDLAQIRLADGVDENKPAIRAEIRNLSLDPELTARALALLLNDSLQSRDSAESLDLANHLSTIKDLTPPNAILCLEAFRRYAHGRFQPYLEQIEKEFAGATDRVVMLTTYLVANGMASDTRSYVESLDPKIRDSEGVQLSYAYSLLTLKDWNSLENFLRNCKWTENEYARYAMLAFRYRVAGRDRDFNDAWHLAVIEVGNNAQRLQTLLQQVTEWNWVDQKYELLWKRFMVDPTNQAVRSELLVYERRREDTSALNRIFARILEQNPGDLDAKNNYAYTNLLLGINLDRAYADAASVASAKPNNPFYLTTEAFALYKQGKAADALKIIQSLDPVALSDPDRALMQSVILVANGKFEDAASIAETLKPTGFLPEERRLLASSAALIAKSNVARGSAERVAALTNQGPAAKGFLRLLRPPLNEKPTVEMQLADSLYSNADYKGLITSLGDDHWGEREFLRLALLAYAQRQQAQNESVGRETWRGALASAGNGDVSLGTLEDLARDWEWTQEYVEIENRRFLRDPSDAKAFGDLAAYYSKINRTAELARIYQTHLQGVPDDADAKARYAYYSLLINSNVSRAYSLAKEAYDAAPDDKFRAKVYAFALYKQSRGADGAQVLEKLSDEPEKGMLQINLLKAALSAQQNQFKEAGTLLKGFDASSALPEETALADTIQKSIAAQNT